MPDTMGVQYGRQSLKAARHDPGSSGLGDCKEKCVPFVPIATAATRSGMCKIGAHELSIMAKSREARRASMPLKIASPAAQNATPVK